jgi:hypothetical protein
MVAPESIIQEESKYIKSGWINEKVIPINKIHLVYFIVVMIVALNQSASAEKQSVSGAKVDS